MKALGVNDVHSQLNATNVREVITPRSATEVRHAIRRAVMLGHRVAVAGGRHAMGGQQFLTGGKIIDTRNKKQVLGLD